MRQISAKVLDDESLSELESGHNVILVRSGKPFAEVVPLLPEAQSPEMRSKEEHAAAVERLRQFMEKGLDLGGFRISNRDELYDRG